MRFAPHSRAAAVLGTMLYISAATLSAQSGEEALPALEIEAVEVDLGKLAPGDSREARFRFTNNGTGPLRIEKAKPG